MFPEKSMKVGDKFNSEIPMTGYFGLNHATHFGLPVPGISV
jgi:hypothetical protein